ncbi:DUF1295 domain-containing protein [Listeria sp. FSL L7-1517]|uniref:DUF1295 domain-containing protein n=1 Tax=Listeria immobilis TaxID=2713502 RepID=UPI00164D519F|nr:DUF1295 domain-containing protein [Listeria immobilis]MBC6296298.1 DUF1295 domain-containing protein [Listeria immobilis]
MYGIKKRTLSAKIFILIAQLCYLGIAVFLFNHWQTDTIIRNSIYFCLIIVFIRLNGMMFLWLPRGISWKEATGNSIAFGLYYLGFPLFAIFGPQNIQPIVYILGIVLFIVGSLLNTVSELLRKPFKDDPANKGKLYTKGLFRYAIHINYLGDILWVAGFALLTFNWWALLIPLGLTCLFIFSYIPNANAYLRQKYGEQFETYEKTTKQLIPFIW